MDLKQRLLQNEIHHLGQIVQTLSYELIVLQDFLKEEYGKKFEAYRKNYSSEVGPETFKIRQYDRSVNMPKKAGSDNPTIDNGVDEMEGIDDAPAASKRETVEDVPPDPLGDNSNMSVDTSDNDSESETLRESLSQPIDDDEERKGGRKKLRIWKYYEKVFLGGNKVSARCNNCQGLVSSRACRLIDHHLKCSNKRKEAQQGVNSRNYVKEIRNEAKKMKNIQNKSSNQASPVLPEPDYGEIKLEKVDTRVKKIGRVQDVIWKYFEEVTVKGLRKARCLACGDHISPKAGRLRHHKIACEEVGTCKTAAVARATSATSNTEKCLDN